VLIVLLVLVVVLAIRFSQKSSQGKKNQLADAKAEARRWVERLGGQVYNLDGTADPAAKQALADAAERYTASGSQLDQATTARQCELVTQTAMEGLYYVRAARTALGMDPGPELPEINGQRRAGAVSEDRKVTVEGHEYEASPNPGNTTPHYYPGGEVAGRPVPRGWYSTPWWKPALAAGAWGVGSFLLFDAMFSGMHGLGDGWGSGFGDGFGGGFDGGGFDGGVTDGGGFDDGGDWLDFGGDGGGFDFDL
jgi:hypothetical protein